MSYISAIRINDDVIVWERGPEGRTFRTFRAPYYFYARPTDWYDERTASEKPYLTYKGEEVYKYEFKTAKEFQILRSELINNQVPLFESDIPSEIRVLSREYYKKETPHLHVTLWDIEVDFDIINGFSNVVNPYAPINSIALYHRWLNKYVVLCVPPNNEYRIGDAPKEFYDNLNVVSPLPEDMKLEVIFCEDERELISYFLIEIEDTDLLSGWNSDTFDMPYMGKRAESLGKKFFKKLSFPEGIVPAFRDFIGRTGQLATTLDLSGRISCDMMNLFIKYEQYGRQSYKLESIAEEILVDKDNNSVLPKLEYEGSLADLYRKNFAHFIRYNLRDTEVLEGLEQRLGYIQTAIEMYHMSTGVYKHVTGTIKLSELAVINECHHELGGLVVNDITKPDRDEQIKGALVLLPQKGEHKYVGSIDVKSLYPSAILSINISPEMLRGQFIEEEFAAKQIAIGSDVMLKFQYETGDVEEDTADNWRTILWERKWGVSGFGTVFDQSKMGIIPTILDKWFIMRKEFQKLKAQAEEAKDAVKIGYYDRMQYIYKIKLNSFYGALSNLYFRFYDLRMGESTTATGRAVLLHQCRKVAETLEGNYHVNFPQYRNLDDHKNAKHMEREDFREIELNSTLEGPMFNGMFQSEVVIYGDTDSTYFETLANNKEMAIKVANAVAKKVNLSYQEFMKDTFLCQPGFDKRISCSRELVTGRGIFVDKKRYILHILDQDGKPCDKMKVMGLDTKKTTLPKEVSKQLNKFVERYLKGEDWNTVATDIVEYKDKILTTENIMSIGLPKGIKGIEDYTDEYKIDKNTNLPGHVAASIFYNTCLETFEDKKSIPIRSGMKIKVFYLSKMVGRFKSIAIPVDIEEVPQWFYENFSVDREAHLERLVDNPLENIIGAINKKVPSKQSLFVDSAIVW